MQPVALAEKHVSQSLAFWSSASLDKLVVARNLVVSKFEVSSDSVNSLGFINRDDHEDES